MKKSLLMLPFLMMLGACCPCADKDPRSKLPLPEPINLEAQVSRLNARAQSIPKLAGRGKIALEYPTERGPKRDETDLVLRMEQTFAADGPPNTNIALFGQFAGNEVFSAVKNQTNWWLAIRMDTKVAYVGDNKDRLARLSRTDIPSGQFFQPETLPDLLGLSELVTQHGFAMTVDDHHGVNEIHEIVTQSRVQLSGVAMNTFQSTIARTIVINRRTGNIDQIKLYNADGTLLAQAIHSDYRPVFVDDQPTGPVVPHKIVITYPARKATATITLDRTENKFGGRPFRMPDFAEQGLTVKRVD